MGHFKTQMHFIKLRLLRPPLKKGVVWPWLLPSHYLTVVLAWTPLLQVHGLREASHPLP